MDLQLAGDKVLIIGAARGMGRAMSEAFVQESCQVFLADLDPAVEKLAGQLAASTSSPVFHGNVNIADYDSVSALAQSVQAQLEGCHHIVIPAGCGSGKYGFPFWNLEPSDWHQTLSVNLMGPVHVAHAFGPMLREAGHGSILFFSSVAAQIGSQTDPPYSAAKAGLLNFAECAAKDFASYNVRVNTLCPGMVKTELNQSVWQAWHDQQPEDARQSYEDWAESKIRQIAPLGRWQTVQEIAAAAVFLASTHARNMTGQAINIDGGQVMHW